MKKAKKKNRKKGYNSLILNNDEMKTLESLLSNIKEIDLQKIEELLPTPQIAEAFINKLPIDSSEAPQLLTAIGKVFKEKKVQKAIKKVSFKLKQKGIVLPEELSTKKPLFHIIKEALPNPTAYLGPIEGIGSRAIFISLPQLPQGVDIGMGGISDENGIIEFMYGRYSKKQANNIKGLFFNSMTSVIETTVPHALSVIEKAYIFNQNNPNEASGNYLQMRPYLLNNFTILEKSPVYEIINLDDVLNNTLSESQLIDLFKHPLMESWIVDPDEIKPITEEIIKAEESPILINDIQKSERIEEIKEKSFNTLFPGQRLNIYKNRLEEIAYIFIKSEEQDLAMQCLTAAVSLDKEDTTFNTNPFLKTLLEHNLGFYESQENGLVAPEDENESQEDSDSGIIIP